MLEDTLLVYLTEEHTGDWPQIKKKFDACLRGKDIVPPTKTVGSKREVSDLRNRYIDQYINPSEENQRVGTEAEARRVEILEWFLELMSTHKTGQTERSLGYFIGNCRIHKSNLEDLPAPPG